MLSRGDPQLDCLQGVCLLGQLSTNSFYILMFFTENLFPNRQCFFVKFFGLIVFSQAFIH